MENSPEADVKRIISDANRTLSNLLLDGECQNESISEQTDSGICTVISSENTSLYDKSPEEKKSFENELEVDEPLSSCKAEDDAQQENTVYTCSKMSSPKQGTSNSVGETCVCNLKGSRPVSSVGSFSQESTVIIILKEKICFN